MKRGYTEPVKRLNFDNVALIPVDTDHWPHNINLKPNSWHVPGRRIMTTTELVALADSRGLKVTLTEQDGDGTSKTTTLN